MHKELQGNLFKDGCINVCDLDGTRQESARPQSKEVMSISYELSKRLFKYKATSFFREFFFTLAPFFMIPLYSHSEDIKCVEDKVYDSIDAESISAEFSDATFRPQETITKIIRKINGRKVFNFATMFIVEATSYYTVPRVDMVPRMAGNGRVYSVPVHWDEYLPRTRRREMFITFLGNKEKDFYKSIDTLDTKGFSIVYKDGYMGLVVEENNEVDLTRISQIINEVKGGANV